jgi:hypothetical protein
MDERARHTLGTVAGLAALVPVCSLTEAAARALRTGNAAFAPALDGLGYLAAVAVLVTLLTAWPAAALACGVPLAATGTLFALDLDAAMGLAGTLPGAETGEPPGTLAGVTGLYALLGVLLLLSPLKRALPRPGRPAR